MRFLLPAMIVVLAGCRSVEDLTRAPCLPVGIPGDVVLQRPGYLYRFDNDDHNSLMDRPYTYGSGRDASGRMLMHSPPPLATLPVGTPVVITRITRETGFDGPYKAIIARGVARVSEGEFDFTYVWGLGNAIHEAPWESSEYAPGRRKREVGCDAG